MTEVSTGGPASRAQDTTLTLSCVILTMGDRPAEVNRAIDSVLAQRGAQVELVVVGNGTEVTGLPSGVRAVWLPENVGVAAGRNAGVQACGGDVVLFLDDDGWYPDPGSPPTSRASSPPTRRWRCCPCRWSTPTAARAPGGTCRGCGPGTRTAPRS